MANDAISDPSHGRIPGGRIQKFIEIIGKVDIILALIERDTTLPPSDMALIPTLKDCSKSLRKQIIELKEIGALEGVRTKKSTSSSDPSRVPSWQCSSRIVIMNLGRRSSCLMAQEESDRAEQF